VERIRTWACGFKAAKLFTARERKGEMQILQKKYFWKIVAEMVRTGESADAAINKVCRVYGQSRTVTQVLNCIREDNKRGGHPDLKVCHL
jgi:pilus assembly protein TadC